MKAIIAARISSRWMNIFAFLRVNDRLPGTVVWFLIFA